MFGLSWYLEYPGLIGYFSSQTFRVPVEYFVKHRYYRRRPVTMIFKLATVPCIFKETKAMWMRHYRAKDSERYLRLIIT